MVGQGDKSSLSRLSPTEGGGLLQIKLHECFAEQWKRELEGLGWLGQLSPACIAKENGARWRSKVRLPS